ncbi:unnamed protein product [Adineta ricciae]|uniref:Uncharacterized protein n=1 Tax=Adineta ricciae TaxID=249248 RepID=A0A815Q2J1_ADIRI|nr:unnamed protein product [Adineta ricciae]CAF1623093.1 unnamed protein product [Adineta ricciae]
MNLLIGSFLIVTLLINGNLGDNRISACPGLPLESCECFQRLYERQIEILNMTDIVARNWAINLWYQDISHSFQKMLETAPDSTRGLPAIGIWTSIASWSSHAVGFSLRQQSIPELWTYVIRNLPQWMQTVLDRIPFKLVELLFQQILEHTAVALGEGNRVIFNDIAAPYSRYGIEFCSGKTKPDDTRLIEFIQKYVCEDGECSLAKAFRALFKAHFGRDESLSYTERDQLLLVQSMYAGLAEQTHVDPYINASLPGYTLINSITTKLMVHIIVGSHRILAEQNIPSGTHNGSDFSPYLSTLTLPEAREVMSKMLNSSTLGLNHTAANDWNSLAQRMRFVAPLFWVFQDHEDMNCYMYTAEQELLIRTNQAHQMDHGSWYRLCDKDCCAANGRWNGNY